MGGAKRFSSNAAVTLSQRPWHLRKTTKPGVTWSSETHNLDIPLKYWVFWLVKSKHYSFTKNNLHKNWFGLQEKYGGFSSLTHMVSHPSKSWQVLLRVEIWESHGFSVPFPDRGCCGTPSIQMAVLLFINGGGPDPPRIPNHPWFFFFGCPKNFLNNTLLTGCLDHQASASKHGDFLPKKNESLTAKKPWKMMGMEGRKMIPFLFGVSASFQG